MGVRNGPIREIAISLPSYIDSFPHLGRIRTDVGGEILGWIPSSHPCGKSWERSEWSSFSTEEDRIEPSHARTYSQARFFATRRSSGSSRISCIVLSSILPSRNAQGCRIERIDTTSTDVRAGRPFMERNETVAPVKSHDRRVSYTFDPSSLAKEPRSSSIDFVLSLRKPCHSTLRVAFDCEACCRSPRDSKHRELESSCESVSVTSSKKETGFDAIGRGLASRSNAS